MIWISFILSYTNIYHEPTFNTIIIPQGDTCLLAILRSHPTRGLFPPHEPRGPNSKLADPTRFSWRCAKIMCLINCWVVLDDLFFMCFYVRSMACNKERSHIWHDELVMLVEAVVDVSNSLGVYSTCMDLQILTFEFQLKYLQPSMCLCSARGSLSRLGPKFTHTKCLKYSLIVKNDCCLVQLMFFKQFNFLETFW